MTKTDRINKALEASFKGSEISVVDDSESHRGHAGFAEGGESHFQIKIVWKVSGSLNSRKWHNARDVKDKKGT